MAVVSHGIDLIECARIDRIWREHPDRFLSRILTSAERAYCERHRDPTPRIAGRFAAKEAILKMLGTGWRGQVAWTDIEILNDESGRPLATLSGECARIAADLGLSRVLISITHTETLAAASAIGVSD